MKRISIVFAAVVALVLATALLAQAQEATPSSNPNQQPAGTMNQAPTTQPTSTTEPAPTTTEASTTTDASRMPKTASPLPAIGLAGLAALTAGVLLSRRRRAA